MAYLAKLAQADAIAIVLNLKSEGYVTYVAHNVPSDTRWADVPQAALLARALTSRTAEQAAGCSIPLADGRTVDFTPLIGPIEDDLATRDFSINAIAERAGSGESVDPFDGYSDLAARRLRATLRWSDGGSRHCRRPAKRPAAASSADRVPA